MLYDFSGLTGETRASGIGVLDPSTFDEMDFVDQEWYEYAPSANETTDVTLGIRNSITMPSVRVDIYASGILDPNPGAGKWSTYANEVTEAYISDDIQLITYDNDSGEILSHIYCESSHNYEIDE